MVHTSHCESRCYALIWSRPAVKIIHKFGSFFPQNFVWQNLDPIAQKDLSFLHLFSILRQRVRVKVRYRFINKFQVKVMTGYGFATWPTCDNPLQDLNQRPVDWIQTLPFCFHVDLGVPSHYCTSAESKTITLSRYLFKGEDVALCKVLHSAYPIMSSAIHYSLFTRLEKG